MTAPSSPETALPPVAAPPDPTARWEDARRLESWAGEIRVNSIRAAAVVTFYGHHLFRMHTSVPAPTPEFHRLVTGVAFVWVLAILGLRHALDTRQVPGWLKYLALGVDIALVSLLLMIAGGPKSPLSILYVVVVASAALRLSLRFVWTATAGCLLGYLAVVGQIIRTQPELRISHPDQVIFMLGLGCVGLLAGQSVRQARRLIRGGSVVVVEEP